MDAPLRFEFTLDENDLAACRAAYGDAVLPSAGPAAFEADAQGLRAYGIADGQAVCEHVPWGDLHGMVATPERFLGLSPSGRAHVVPRRAFPDAASLERFEELWNRASEPVRDGRGERAERESRSFALVALVVAVVAAAGLGIGWILGGQDRERAPDTPSAASGSEMPAILTDTDTGGSADETPEASEEDGEIGDDEAEQGSGLRLDKSQKERLGKLLDDFRRKVSAGNREGALRDYAEALDIAQHHFVLTGEFAMDPITARKLRAMDARLAASS